MPQHSHKHLKTLQLKVRDTNGNVQERTIVPTVDPYQQQTDILAIRQSWRWDGFTSIAVDLIASAFCYLLLLPIRKRQPYSRTCGAVSSSWLRQPECCPSRQGCSRTGRRRRTSAGIIYLNLTRRRRGKFFPRLFLFL